MSVYQACKARRTIRRFSQEPIARENLLRYIDAARIAPSGANLQPLKYRLVDTPEACAALFPHLAWAGYLRPAGTPEENERPTAYIVALHDVSARPAGMEYDAGAALMSIILCAQDDGIASCWLGSVERDAVHAMYSLPDHLRVLHVIALGYPAQTATAVPMQDGNVRYYMDEQDVLRVPKRSLEDILV